MSSDILIWRLTDMGVNPEHNPGSDPKDLDPASVWIIDPSSQ